MNKVTRLEIIDHCACSACNGTGIIMNNKNNGKGIICGKCDGATVKGRTVVFWDKNKKIDLSVQDEGRTLKIFITNRGDQDGS